MGYIIDAIRKSALIIKMSITEDSEPQVDCDMEPEPEFDDMVKFIEIDSIDVVENNDEND